MSEYNPLKNSKTDNAGLKPNSKIGTFLKDKKVDSMSRAFKAMQNSHNETFSSFSKIDADKTLTKEAKDLVKGSIGIKAKEEFKNHATRLRGDAQGMLKSLNESLYTNTATIDQNQVMMIGLVGEQLKEEGLAYLDRSDYVHPIAVMMAKAQLLPHGQSEMVLDKLNRKHSSETLSNIKATEDLLTSIDFAIEEEDKLITANTPADDELKALQASSALTEVRKLTRGV